MILDFLNQFRKANNSIRKLRLCDNFERIGDPSLKSIEITDYKEDFLMIAPRDHGEMAYFLPWKEDTGFYIYLPKNTPQTLIFLTSELSGCFVGVQNLDDVYRIRHYNFQTMDIDGKDFCRYNFAGHLVHWLAPQRGNVSEELKKVNAPHEVYDNYSGHSPILFWGEFVDNDWQFYYQTTDNTIHRFLVI